jgi:uncharacterized membrane protein
MGIKVVKNLGPILMPLVLSILGARLQNTWLLYIDIIIICFIFLLGAFGLLDKKIYPYVIFSIGLSMLYQVTLMSPYLIGSDIQGEFYCAYRTYIGGWNHTMDSIYNSALGISVLAPWISKTLHLDLYWVFKVIFPICLAGVPVVLYKIYRQEFGTRIAFLSSFFFITVPTFFVELSTVAKQQIGELLLIGCLSLIILRIKIKPWIKYSLVFILLSLTSLAHYSMGAIGFIFLGGLLVILLFFRLIFRTKFQTNLKVLLVILLISIPASGFYLGWVASGAPLKSFRYLGTYLIEWIPSIWENKPTGLSPTDLYPIEGNSTIKIPISSSPPSSYFDYQPSLVKVALGIDFIEVSFLGKVFRIFQLLTQVLIVLGFLIILKNRKKYSLEYLALMMVGALILILVIFLPGFSAILNATRFYNLSLLFLSPAAIVGGRFILRKDRFLAIILVSYFLFTSGLIYEASKRVDVSLDIPYSNALSAKRAGTNGIYTINDGKVRDWIVSNEALRPIYTDLYGKMFIENKIDYKKSPMFLPYVPSTTPKDCYMFMTEWNEGNQKVVFWTNIGERLISSYTGSEVDKVLEGRPIIYQVGLAKIYGPKE